MFDRSILPASVNEVLDQQMYNNSIEKWLIAEFIFFGTILGLWLFKKYVIQKAKHLATKSKTEIDDVIVKALNTINLPFYLVLAVFLSSRYLHLEPFWDALINHITIIVIVIYATLAIQKIVIHGINTAWHLKKEKLAMSEGFESFLKTTSGLFLWTIALIVLLQTLGFNPSTLIGGLGIAGIAIAFSLQSVLIDVFAYITIYLGKPFKVGDMIAFEGERGTVLEIGKRTTRIQTIQGQELIVTNKHLTDAKINNYSKMSRRQVVLKVGVTYETSQTKLQKIPDILRKIIRETDNCTLDRVHFTGFGTYSLDFEVAYYVGSREYSDFMDAQQTICYVILEAFAKAKIELAYPSQIVHSEPLATASA